MTLQGEAGGIGKPRSLGVSILVYVLHACGCWKEPAYTLILVPVGTAHTYTFTTRLCVCDVLRVHVHTHIYARTHVRMFV